MDDQATLFAATRTDLTRVEVRECAAQGECPVCADAHSSECAPAYLQELGALRDVSVPDSPSVLCWGCRCLAAYSRGPYGAFARRCADWCADWAREPKAVWRDEVWTVDDPAGGTWWPHAEAAAEIERSDDPEAAALALCDLEPMRGEWRS